MTLISVSLDIWTIEIGKQEEERGRVRKECNGNSRRKADSCQERQKGREREVGGGGVANKE